MVTIRSEQMRILAATCNRAVLLRHAEQYHPEIVRNMDRAALETVLDQVVAGILRYRLATQSDFSRLLDLSLLFGTDWERPDLHWLNEGMNDVSAGSPAARLAKLSRRALRRLAAAPSLAGTQE